MRKSEAQLRKELLDGLIGATVLEATVSETHTRLRLAAIGNPHMNAAKALPEARVGAEIRSIAVEGDGTLLLKLDESNLRVEPLNDNEAWEIGWTDRGPIVCGWGGEVHTFQRARWYERALDNVQRFFQRD